jgi:hypothetical protein
VKGNLTSPSSSSSDSNMSSEAKEQQTTGGGGSSSHGGPKLPKLILSMRDKTVKQKFSKHLSSSSSSSSVGSNPSVVINQTSSLQHSDDSDSENGEISEQSKSSSKKFIPKSSPKISGRTLDQHHHSAVSTKLDNKGLKTSSSSSRFSSCLYSSTCLLCQTIIISICVSLY